MPRFEFKQSRRHLTSYAGISLVGQCFEMADISSWLDGHLPTSGHIKTSDIVKSMTALLTLGKHDFDAIEPFRKDRFFHEALKISKVPSPEWLRQKLDKLGQEDSKGNSLRDYTHELSTHLIERSKAPITAHNGYVRLDFDTFIMNNSGTKKEEVSRTYQGVDGYTPIAAYLGSGRTQKLAEETS